MGSESGEGGNVSYDGSWLAWFSSVSYFGVFVMYISGRMLVSQLTCRGQWLLKLKLIERPEQK